MFANSAKAYLPGAEFATIKKVAALGRGPIIALRWD